MKQVILLFSLCASASGACFPVVNDKITGRDLATVDPHFSALPATLTIGFAPTPGVPRIFASAELLKIARANGIAATDASDTCFEISMRPLTAEAAIQTMRGAFRAETEIRIIELPKTDIPVGELQFPLNTLEPATVAVPDIQLWHGFVKYAGTRRMPVWARVSVLQRLEAVVTSRDLAPNVPVTPQSLRIETWAGQPVRERVAVRLEDVLGRVPKRALKAGSLIPLALLDDAPAVRRGETVKVEVRSGPTRLIFSAVAEKAARDGDTVEFRNPSSGKTFLARIEGAKAVVLVGGL